MSLLERITELDGCLQCWAETMLAADAPAMEREIERQLKGNPAMVMVGLPEPEQLARMVRAGRRETTLVARLALLDPHECGRRLSPGPPPVASRGVGL